MIFGMCKSWVILRRNVIYLYSKKVILIDFFTLKVPDMTSFGELQISFLLFSAPKIPQMTSYPAASRAEKSIKTSFFLP